MNEQAIRNIEDIPRLPAAGPLTYTLLVRRRARRGAHGVPALDRRSEDGAAPARPDGAPGLAAGARGAGAGTARRAVGEPRRPARGPGPPVGRGRSPHAGRGRRLRSARAAHDRRAPGRMGAGPRPSRPPARRAGRGRRRRHGRQAGARRDHHPLPGGPRDDRVGHGLGDLPPGPLARGPHCAARAEADALGRPPRHEDLPRLKLATRVFKETLRLYPPLPLFTRDARAELTVGGYRLPAGTVLIVCPYATHHRADLWPDPERFDPERFTPEAEAARPRYAYLPFSAGPRVCIGNHFALMEGALVLATLLQRADFRALRPSADVEPEVGATLRPKGMSMRIRRRAPAPHLG